MSKSDILTIDEIFQVAAQSGLKPKSWGSYKLKTYNGFTHEQRVYKWQALNLAMQMGLVQQAHLSPCSICGKTSGPETIAFHSEDYGSMSGHYPLCKGCHTRVHKRFTNPERWREFIAPFCNGSSWFENLLTEEQPQQQRLLITNETTVSKICTHSTSDALAVKPIYETVSCSSIGIHEEMHQIRIAFTKVIGLDWSENPNPNSGYKFEHNLNRRQQLLDEAVRFRDLYSEMVNMTGRGKDILEKMDRNLVNRDRKAVWNR